MYLSRTALLIRNGEVDVADTESFLLDNVFREMDGLEEAVMSDKKASKCFETVCNVATRVQLRGFLHRLCLGLGVEDAAYATLCCNPFASHSLEALFTRLTDAPDGNLAEAPERDSQGILMASLGELVLGWLQRMGSDVLGMASHVSACHVLRALTLLLGGCQWVSKAARASFALGSGLESEAEQRRRRTGLQTAERRPEEWQNEGLEQLMGRVCRQLEESSGEEVQETVSMPAGSATLQLMVAVLETAGGGRMRDEMVRCVLGMQRGKKKEEEKKGETGWAGELARDGVGSRLLEAVVGRAGSKEWELLWRQLLMPEARALAVHAAGNYALLAGLLRAEKEAEENRGREAELQEVLDAVSRPDLVALFRGGRLGVVAAVVRGAGRAGKSEEGRMRRRRVLALMAQSDRPGPVLEQLVGRAGEREAGASRPLLEVAAELHRLGEEGAEVLDRFWDGLTEEQVAACCCGRAWSMLVEAMLTGHSKAASKSKLIRKMMAAWPRICQDKYGHHTALAALQTAERMGEQQLGNRLRLQVKQQRETLVGSQWGAKLLKKLSEREDERQAEQMEQPEELTVDSLLATGKRERPEQQQQKKKKEKKHKQ